MDSNDSSYGGSDTAQDHNTSLETSIPMSNHEVTIAMPTNTNLSETSEPQFYHKNEVTLPVNYDETDEVPMEFKTKEPHYLSTANLNINETLEHHSNLEEMSRNYKSTNYLNSDNPKSKKKEPMNGVDNMAYQDEDMHNGDVKSTFDNKKPYNGDYKKNYPEMNMGTPTKAKQQEEPLAEAVNLELINLKPNQDVAGPYAMGNGSHGSNGTNGMTEIPMKKETEESGTHPYNDYFVPVNEHKKYMRPRSRNSVTFAEGAFDEMLDQEQNVKIRRKKPSKTLSTNSMKRPSVPLRSSLPPPPVPPAFTGPPENTGPPVKILELPAEWLAQQRERYTKTIHMQKPV